MPMVDIIAPDAGPGRVASTHGTRLVVDGRDIDDVRDIAVSIPLDGLITVRAEVLVSERFRFTTAADLHVTVVTDPEFVVCEDTAADGTKRYTAVRRPSDA